MAIIRLWFWGRPRLPRRYLGRFRDCLRGLLGNLEALPGLGPSSAFLERSWGILAALVVCFGRLGSHLGHLGRLGERPGGVRQPVEHLKEGAMCASEREYGGGLSLD